VIFLEIFQVGNLPLRRLVVILLLLVVRQILPLRRKGFYDFGYSRVWIVFDELGSSNFRGPD